MKLGMFAGLRGPQVSAQMLRDVGTGAEDIGLSSIWLGEHVVLFSEHESNYPGSADGKIDVPVDQGLMDLSTTIGFLSAITKNIRFGTGICLVPQRNPLYTAKEMATADHLSDGRVDFGIGVGWSWEEFEACGVPFERRGARTDEYVELMKLLWTEHASSFEGEFYSLPSCHMYPKPIQDPFPIHVGGHSRAALRRTARYGHGWFGFGSTPEQTEKLLSRLDEELDKVGRTPATRSRSRSAHLANSATSSSRATRPPGSTSCSPATTARTTPRCRSGSNRSPPSSRRWVPNEVRSSVLQHGPYVDPARGAELVQAGEAAGFESAWTVEHTVVPSNYTSTYPYDPSGKMAGGRDDFDLPDPLIWMSFMAGVTSTIKFATGILIVPQHNPVLAAKQIATLDHLSKGRILLGIGVGWLEEEFNAMGIPFADRGARTDEYIAVMRELWSSESPTFHGDFIDFDDTHCRPQPVDGSVPIIVGGDTKPAARRAGRLGDGYFPARGAPQEMLDLARRTAEEHGRDPDAIEITTSIPDDLDDIAALAARGVSRLLVPVTSVAGPATAISGPDDIARWADIIEQHAET